MTSSDFDDEALATLDLLAFLNLQYGRGPEADKYYRFLLDFRPEDARLLRASALAKLLSGQVEEALPLCEKALQHCAEKSPDAVATHLLLSDLYARLERPDDAARHAQKYLQLRADPS